MPAFFMSAPKQQHKFDQATADRFMVAVRAGARDEVAAAHADLPLDTLRAWEKGSTEKTRKFVAAVEKARADLSLLATGTLRREISENPATAMYFAESMATDNELKRLRRLTT